MHSNAKKWVMGPILNKKMIFFLNFSLFLFFFHIAFKMELDSDVVPSC